MPKLQCHSVPLFVFSLSALLFESHYPALPAAPSQEPNPCLSTQPKALGGRRSRLGVLLTTS